MTKNKFAIAAKDGAYVVGSIPPTQSYRGQFAHPLIIGTKGERKLYPTRKAAQLELNRTCSLGDFEIVAA